MARGTYSSIYIDPELVQRVIVLADEAHMDRSANWLYIKAIEEFVEKQEKVYGITHKKKDERA
jgi:predicted transcriptional regulator